MPLVEKLIRFARQPRRDRWRAMQAALERCFSGRAPKRFNRIRKGPLVPPRVTQGRSPFYIAYRPDSDVKYGLHPELSQLSEKWVRNNVTNNAGDLPRLYSLILNVKQTLLDGVQGDLA